MAICALKLMPWPRPHAHRNKVGTRLAVNLAQEVEQPRAPML
jgi:hypothetical protein